MTDNGKIRRTAGPLKRPRLRFPPAPFVMEQIYVQRPVRPTAG